MLGIEKTQSLRRPLKKGGGGDLLRLSDSSTEPMGPKRRARHKYYTYEGVLTLDAQLAEQGRQSTMSEHCPGCA